MTDETPTRTWYSVKFLLAVDEPSAGPYIQDALDFIGWLREGTYLIDALEVVEETPYRSDERIPYRIEGTYT